MGLGPLDRIAAALTPFLLVAVSFLNQLKSQANALQREQSAHNQDLAKSTELTELACKRAWFYLEDLAKQLNVIAPPGPKLSLDGKTFWPDMKLQGFRVDARKKMLRAQEVYDTIGMWWRIVPQHGQPMPAQVSVNFPPDWQRVEQRLSMGQIKHERKEIRHPEKATLLAYCFEYLTETRGTLTLTPDHDKGLMGVRIANTRGFEAQELTVRADQVSSAWLDELAKRLLGQTSILG